MKKMYNPLQVTGYQLSPNTEDSFHLLQTRKISKRILLTVAIFTLLLIFGHTTTTAGELPFKDKERLEFSLKWIGLVGGRAVIELKRQPSEDTKERRYLIKAVLRTVAFADVLFKVRDEFSSIVTVNSQNFNPEWYEVSQKEKDYRYQKKIDYTRIEEKEPDLQNPLSALFFLRLKELKVGEVMTVPVHTHGKIYHVKVSTISREPLKIYGKTFQTILVDVSLEGEKLKMSSIQIPGLKIWFSDDKNRIPLFMKANTSIGPITVLLTNRGEFFNR